MNRLTTDFKTVYQRLNQAQRKAVDTLEGPVLVIAGPGTGKTEILAARIANILLSTDATPESILCLTYTDAGTVAMRSRLLQFIGPMLPGRYLYLSSLCNLLIQKMPIISAAHLTTTRSWSSSDLCGRLLTPFPMASPALPPRYPFESTGCGVVRIMKNEDWDRLCWPPGWMLCRHPAVIPIFL